MSPCPAIPVRRRRKFETMVDFSERKDEKNIRKKKEKIEEGSISLTTASVKWKNIFFIYTLLLLHSYLRLLFEFLVKVTERKTLIGEFPTP